MKLLLILFTQVFLSSVTWAWGGKGHDLICQAATHVVQNKNLKDFMKTREHMMGHLCNIPDIHWKSLGTEANKLGNSAHFIDAEVIGLKPNDIPTDYNKIINDYTGKKNSFKEGTIFSIPTEFGSLWWRADQFARLALEAGKEIKTAPPPRNQGEERDDTFSYNKAVHNFIVASGLLGHFVGDNSQPFHTTADYDGWGAGHGGIHAYYEESIVSAQDANLYIKVINEAQKLQKSKASFLTQKTTVEKMRALSALSFADIKKVYALDPLLKKSQEISDKGLKNRTPAERESAGKVAKKFEALLIAHMGRSVALLANIWDDIYKQAGEPDLSKYKSFRYPHTPDFVAPDYFDTKAELTSKK